MSSGVGAKSRQRYVAAVPGAPWGDGFRVGDKPPGIFSKRFRNAASAPRGHFPRSGSHRQVFFGTVHRPRPWK